MDPNETLAELRERLGPYIRGESTEGEADILADVAELMTDLDTWLSKGGFFPAAWMEGRK